MAKAYTNVNSTTGTFAGWLSKSNELFYDMSTMIVTVADVSAPNSSNEARTTGNADIQGIFSANNIVVWDTLAGGRNEEWANTDTLYIVSNTQIGNSSQTDTLTVYGDATFDANVQIGSAATDGLTIAANTVVNGLSFFTANTRFNDNARISFGTDSDTSLYHDGSDLKLIHNNANTSDFIIEDVSGNDVFTFTTDHSTFTVARYDDATDGPSIVLLDEGTTPDAANVGGIFFKGQDSGSAVTEYAAIKGIAEDNTNATEDGALLLYTTIGGTAKAMVAVNEASDTAVSLRFDGSEKLATTTNGISVTGLVSSTTVTSSGLTTADSLSVTNNAAVGGNLTVTGQLLATGTANMTVNNATFTTMSVIGDTDIGDQTSDTVTITARVDSDIVPSTDSARDLGTTSLRWRNAYIDDLTLTANVNLQTRGSALFYDADNSNYVAFKSPATISSNITWTLPDADATTSGQALVSNASGVLSWGSSGISTTSDTSTNAEEQIYFGDVTSGSITAVHHDADLTYNPSTGTLTSAAFAGVASSATTAVTLTGLTSTVAELNKLDGDTAATSTTLADADRVVVNDAGTMKQVALTDFNTYFTGTFLTGGSADIKTSGDLTFNDNVAINLGTGADVEILHDGTNLLTDINTGNFQIRDGADSNATRFTFTPSSAALEIKNADAAADGPTITLRHDTASPAASDEAGQIFFQSDNDAAENITYASIDALIADVSDGSEDGS